jgi:hypothetical protein
MKTTLSSYPLPSRVCALARERERERGEACVVFVGGIVSSVCEGFQGYRVRGRFYC